MKRRLGFVSNSSSSSFTCDICGREETAYDLSYEDAEMFECTNGHIICDEHALCDLVDEDSEDDNDDSHYDVAEKCCPICCYKEISYYDARNYLKKRYGVSEDLVFQKIKEVNKRRKKLYDEEYVNYVFKENNITDDSFLESIKTEFKSYSDYKNWKPEEK